MEKTNSTFLKIMRPAICICVMLCLFSGLNEVSAQGGDDCATAQAVMAGTHNATTFAGAGAANNCNTAATMAKWYSFTAPGPGTVDITSENDPNLPDTRLSVYDGSCAALNCIADDDDGGAGLTSLITGLAVCPGTPILIEWDDRWDNTDFTWDLTFTAAAAGPANSAALGADGCTATISWMSCDATATVEACPSGVAPGGAGCVVFAAVTSPFVTNLCAAGFAPGAVIDITVTDGVGTGAVSTVTLPGALNCTTGMPMPVASENFDAGGAQTGATSGQWNIDSNGTGSTGTGPLANSAPSLPNYVYYEASGNNSGATFNVLTDVDLRCFDDAQLGYQWHAFGLPGDVTAAVQASSDNVNWITIASHDSGDTPNQADPFTPAVASLAAFVGGPVSIRLLNIQTATFEGDVAFDDFVISGCASSMAPVTGPTSTCALAGDGCTATIEWQTCDAAMPAGDVEICPAGVASGGMGCVSFPAVISPFVVDLCAAGFGSQLGPQAVAITVTDAGGTGAACALTLPQQGLSCAGGMAATTVVTENFDAGGAQTNATNGQFNIDSNGTGSGSTGPLTGSAPSAPNYLYYEASGASNVGATEVIFLDLNLSSCFTDAQLQYKWHAAGDPGEVIIEVQVSSDNTNWTPVGSHNAGDTPNQADPFTQAFGNLNAFIGGPVSVRLEVVQQTSFTGDIAFDDFEIVTCGDACPGIETASAAAPVILDLSCTNLMASISTPASTGCPPNSTYQYSLDNINFSPVPPAYPNTPVTVYTRCSCDCDPTGATASPATATMTNPVILGPPVANCVPGITLTLVNGVATLTSAQVNNGSTAQCGTAEVKISQDTFTCDDVSPVDVTLTVTDSQTGAIAMCTTPVTLLTPPPTMVCAPFTVTINATGSATIMGSDVDGGSSGACGDPVLSVAPNVFSCAEVGVQTVTLTGTDPITGLSSTCDAMVTVLGSAGCVVPGGPLGFTNNDPSILDPCTCDGVGGFDEEVLVTSNAPGQMWEVLTVTGLTYGSGGAPVMVGDPLTDLGNGNYILTGLNHLDAVGYSISVISPLFPGVRFSITNTCFYPLIIVDVPFDTIACEFTDPIPLIGQGVSQRDGATPVDGVGEFTVNGIVATELNPLELGVGTHIVEFCFNAEEALGFTNIRLSTTSFPPPIVPFAQNLVEAQLDPGCEVCQTNEFVILGTPSSIACNGGINVSLEGSCSALITADMILEGSYPCFDDYEVALEFNNTPIANPVDFSLAGQVITTQITHLPSGNQCWGEMIIEDKLPPELNCNIDFLDDDGNEIEGVIDVFVGGSQTFFIPCTIDPADVPAPTATDNCTGTEVFLVSEEVVFEAACNAIDNFTVSKRIIRTYGVKDVNGNEGNQCSIEIQVYQVPIQFPDDITWTCEQFAANNNIVEATGLNQVILNNINDGEDDVELVLPYFGYPAYNPVNTWWLDNEDLDVTLNENDSDDAAILAMTGSGVPRTSGQQEACNHSFTFIDQVASACEGADISETFKIIRTWTALNWCTGVTTVDVQIIKVLDRIAPEISFPNGFEGELIANQSIGGSHPVCASDGLLSPAIVTDNCSGINSLRVFTSVGEGIPEFNGNGDLIGYRIPEPYLLEGDHEITYEAIDNCGNITTVVEEVTVEDGFRPIPICREITTVALSSNPDGLIEVRAEFFDEASYDNCGPIYFKVRRMDNNCSGFSTDRSRFNDEIRFCCEDIGETINVVLRVYDVNPGIGTIGINTNQANSNECMIEVLVEDKSRPSCIAPADVWVNCNEVADNFDFEDFDVTNAVYGEATGFDNCSFIVENVAVNVNLDQCGVGSITRTFRTVDDADNRSTGSCSQTIMIQPVTEYCITFPEDFEGECNNSFSPDELTFDEIGCDLLAINKERLDFFAGGPDGECKKEIYTWQVINWCEYDGISMPTIVNRDGNGNGNVDDGRYCSDGNTLSMGSISYPSTGFYQWEQLIKIFDNTPPEISYDGDIEFCGGDLDEDPCTGLVNIALDIEELCTDQITTTWSISTFSNTFTNANLNGAGNIQMRLPLGTHTARFEVADDCGNESGLDITFTIIDCKAPTPVCFNGLSVSLMPTRFVSVWASDFDASSFDYCHDFEVTANVVTDVVADGVINEADYATVRPTDREIVLDCDDAGEIIFVQLWVHELSNDGVNDDDFCVTFIEVIDNGVCTGSRTSIAGNTSDEKGENIENVDVNLSVDMTANFMTTDDGQYSFDVNEGGDYSITPMKNDDIRNGVSTFDLALISKHVLNVAPLNSPYKIIAADANKSGSVTTLDLVAIRKLVLFVANEFPNNTSWRFVDKDYLFTNPQNPFASVFPEVKNYNNITGTNITDFVGIKIGDVSGDAKANSLSGIDDRSFNGTFNLNTENQTFEAGEKINVTINADLQSIDGFQATLNFNAKAVELLDIESATLTKENFGTTMTDDGIITVSWNGNATSDEAFTLAFSAKAAGTVSDILSVSSNYTVAEAYEGTDLLNVGMNFGGTQVTQVFSLHQNTPNPFKSETMIGFELPKADAATLTISDLSGKVLRVLKGNYEAGYNSILVEMTNSLPTGVLIYELETSTDKATKKMTVVR